MLLRLPRKLLGLIYVAVGVFLAYSKDYLENLDTLKRVALGPAGNPALAVASAGHRPPVIK